MSPSINPSIQTSINQSINQPINQSHYYLFLISFPPFQSAYFPVVRQSAVEDSASNSFTSSPHGSLKLQRGGEERKVNYSLKWLPATGAEVQLADGSCGYFNNLPLVQESKTQVRMGAKTRRGSGGRNRENEVALLWGVFFSLFVFCLFVLFFLVRAVRKVISIRTQNGLVLALHMITIMNLIT